MDNKKQALKPILGYMTTTRETSASVLNQLRAKMRENTKQKPTAMLAAL